MEFHLRFYSLTFFGDSRIFFLNEISFGFDRDKKEEMSNER